MASRFADRLGGISKRNPYQFWMDLETHGLQTPSYMWGVKEGATEFGPAISELAFGGAGRSTRVRGYSKSVTQEMLGRHSVTLDTLRKKGALPTSLTRELTAHGPQHWDPSVGVHGSTLQNVFRQHARHVLKGRPTSSLADMTSGMLGQIERRLGKGGPVELLGWNIAGFDIPTLHGQLRLLAKQTGNEALLKRFEGTMGKVKIKEAAEVYHGLLYDRMLKTNFMPVISNRAAMNAAAGRQIKTFGDVAQARKAGVLADHTPLRAFMDDVRAHTVRGERPFEKRATNWARQYMGQGEASAIGRALQEEMASVGGTLGSFHNVAERLASRRHIPLLPGITSHSAFDVLNMSYKGQGQAHMNIISSPDIIGVGGSSPVTAFQFAGGGKQGQVGQSFLQAASDTGWKHHSLDKLKRRLARGHVGETDRQAAKLLYGAMQRAPQHVMDRLGEIHVTVGNAEKLGLARVNETMQDLVRGQSDARAVHAAARGTEQKITGEALHAAAGARRSAVREALAHTPEHVGAGGSLWVKAGLMVAGLAFLSERNKPAAPIQGLRDPESEHRVIEGLNPSEMPGANQSWFFSGYHSWESMMMTASKLGKPWTNPYSQDRNKSMKGLENATAQGNMIGALIEQDLMQAGIAEQPEFQFYGAGMEGRSDVMMRGGLTVELKTVADDAALSMMRSPRDKDIGQANYDAVVSNTPYAYIMYASRQDPNKRRVFRQYRDPGLLAQQQADLSMQIDKNPGVPSNNFKSFLSQRLGNLIMETLYNLHLYGRPPEYKGEDPLASYAGGDYVAPFDSGRLAAHPNDQTDGNGYAGLSSSLFEGANMSKIRDQATQLGRLPGLPRTTRGRMSMSGNAHAEMASFQDR